MKVWDLRKGDVLYTLIGHNDTVTGVSVSPDGSYLASNSMDNTGKGSVLMHVYTLYTQGLDFFC